MKITGPTRLPLVAALCVAALLGASGGAVAERLVTGADIRDESITQVDIKDGSIAPQDLSRQTNKAVRRVGGYALVTRETEASSGPTAVSGACPRGTRVLGVSGYFGVSNLPVQTLISDDAKGAVALSDGITPDDTLIVQVVCGRVA
jgi:hypothetical protein